MDPGTRPEHAPISGVVVVLLVDFLASKKSWGWMKLAQGASNLKQLPGLLFSKVMGSGHEGGFGLRPSSTHQGLVLLFDTRANAQTFLDSDIAIQYKEHAREWWSGTLVIDSSRGEWNAVSWAPTDLSKENLKGLSHDSTLVATLTRASIRPASALAFWRYAPQAQADLSNASGCVLAMGLGEAPLVRQCTFSVWRDTQSMLNYAQGGAHRTAIQAAYKHTFFSESMFVRMRVLSMAGVWKGIYYPHQPSMQKPYEVAHA
jgi:hypothetical protein